MDLEAVSRTAAQLNEMGAASACLGLGIQPQICYGHLH